MIILKKKTERDQFDKNIKQFLSSTDSFKDKTLEQMIEELQKLQENSKDMVDCKSRVSVKDINKGQKFYGTITTTITDPKTGKKVRTSITDMFKMLNPGTNGGNVTVEDSKGNRYKTSRKGIKLRSFIDDKKTIELQKKVEEELKEKMRKQKEFEEKSVDFDKVPTQIKIKRTIESGIKNIWLCGPAGSGKSFMTRQVAEELGLPYLCISCGIGTSSTEFLGYKYPNRESTRFAEFYSKPSVILLDEFTALDPAVAQICNAALANDEIETTTGTVHRDPNCIIIATSNTYGSGASRQYVANNQLDASTIDRFIGGIIEVNYSEEFESKYDKEVVQYVNDLREIIASYDLRKIASTRMIQAGTALKNNWVKNWKSQLIINWSSNEKRIVRDYFMGKAA